MRIISFFLLLSLTNADAQTIDTVKGAKAWKNTYLQTDVYGKMNNGHYYNIGFVNLYDSNGKMKGIQVVRLDLTTGNAIHKILPGGWPADLFANAFDSLGNVYFGFNSNNRKI